MRDIPMFTTENGVASLLLTQIPYTADAYVRIFDSTVLERFIEECADFCHMAGAKRVYFTGTNIPDIYPLFTEIWQMQYPASKLPKTDATLVAVDDTNAEIWRKIYNDRMADIPTAAFMSRARTEQLLKSGNAYFIYRDTALLGIGAVSEQSIDCIASVTHGAGKDVLYTLATVLMGDLVHLQVASENKRAVSFYEKLGFEKTDVKEIWYQYIK